tara:strand:+ start:4087 stop:5007 length:921 start_codon:yes stop_codon:yes gene_type:complete
MESLFSRTTVQFIAAYENLNFRIAAEKCFVTQPAITKSIKKIESDYKIKLFDKKGTKMIPTDFADDLYKELLLMRDSANNLRLKFENLHQGNSGFLNIAVGLTLQSTRGFVDLINDINIKFPNLVLNIASMTKINSIPLLKEGDIDLWIGDITNLKNDNEFIKKFIKKIPLVIFAKKNDKIFNNKKITFSQLNKHKWSLLYGSALQKTTNQNFVNDLTSAFNRNGINIEKNLTTFSSTIALFASARSNGSFAIAPKTLSNVAENFDLKEIDNLKIMDLDIGLLVRNKIANYKIIKFMIDLILKNIG